MLDSLLRPAGAPIRCPYCHGTAFVRGPTLTSGELIGRNWRERKAGFLAMCASCDGPFALVDGEVVPRRGVQRRQPQRQENGPPQRDDLTALFNLQPPEPE